MSAFKEDIEEFAKISRAYPSEVLRQKRGGIKAVCYYGSRVPVEIVHVRVGNVFEFLDLLVWNLA